MLIEVQAFCNRVERDLDRLIEEFESSEYLEQAKKLSETLKADEKKAKNGSVSHDS